jgi:hypothetical protein
MTLRSDLLARGFLPENLPPVFTSNDLGGFAEAHLPANEYLTKKQHRTRPAPYNASKRGHQRRIFSIPNPIAAADTALFLNLNWFLITEHFDKSLFSASRPTVDSTGPRAIAITPHEELSHLRNERLAASRYIVSTDISRFFPSIYTHALPWAFHGKARSKADQNTRSKSIFFNRLDYILRQAQDGQTIGIPVGPDSSRIIAEIIATAVDADFLSQLKRTQPALLRHVDDVWIGARTQSEADHLLYSYKSVLREYELDINELKTSISPATKDVPHFWPKELGDLVRSEFAGVRGHGGSRNSERMFVLDRVLDLANRHSDDGIIKFALRRLDAVHAWASHWDALEPFMLRCFVNYPHSVDYVARVLAWRARVGAAINIKRWQDALNEFIGFHARLRNDSEVCWALWLARELRANVHRGAARSIINDCGPIPLTLLCDCIDRGTVRSFPDRDRVQERLRERPLSGSFWFFAYEAWRREWIDGFVVAGDPLHDFFQPMYEAGVSFFDPNALPNALEGKEEEEWELAEAIEDIAGEYEDDEDDWNALNLFPTAP